MARRQHLDIHLLMHQLLAGLTDITTSDIKKAATGDCRLVIGRNRAGRGIGRPSGVADECQREQASEGHNSIKHSFPPRVDSVTSYLMSHSYLGREYFDTTVINGRSSLPRFGMIAADPPG